MHKCKKYFGISKAELNARIADEFMVTKDANCFYAIRIDLMKQKRKELMNVDVCDPLVDTLTKHIEKWEEIMEEA